MNKRKIKIIIFTLVFLTILSSYPDNALAINDYSIKEEDFEDNIHNYNEILHEEIFNNNLNINDTKDTMEPLQIKNQNYQLDIQNNERILDFESNTIDGQVIEDSNIGNQENNIKNGWQKIDGNWYYYENGITVTGWLKDGSKWYYLDNNGVMLTGWQKIDDTWYFFTSSGAMKTGWLKDNDKWYYLKPSGAMATGWIKVDDQWYYLRSSGAMATGWLNINNKWYYLKSSGAMAIGWLKVENDWYYMKSTGEMVTGDFEINGEVNYFANSGKWQGVWEKDSKGVKFKFSNGTYPKNQWANLGGKWYYFDKNSYMQTHWQKINNKWYYLGTDGVMRTGWIQVNSKWYYMDSSGAMQTGWLKLNNKTYYLDNSGAMHIGWLELDNKRYYMDETGAMYTGWLEFDDKTYYLDNDGVMHTGWLQLDNSWYYMDKSGIMQTGWVRVNGKWYYMNKNGVMQTGWIKVNNKWYYMNNSGAMHTGWLELGDEIYYLDSSGAMQTGWIQIDNTWYFFNNNGLLQQKSIYDTTFEEALAKQMKVSPQTDYYGGGWKDAKEEDVAFFLNPENFYGKELPAIKVTADALNFISSPDSSSSSNIITTLKKNEVYVLMDKQDNWYKIIAKGRIGWVYGTYVELTTIENDQMFQFLDLSKSAGISLADVDNILSGKGILDGKGKIFLEACNQYKVNEIYLLAHALLETGNGGSELATGVLVTEVDGIPVEPKVVYNMFGINAKDGTKDDPDRPIRLGSEYAYKQGWFTPEQAIIGGAKFIAENYIYRSNNTQNTLYKMRWNPENPATHQYATDIAWAYKQVNRIKFKDLYALCTEYNIYFDIPEYKK